MATIFHEGDPKHFYNITYRLYDRFDHRWGKEQVEERYSAPNPTEAERSYKSYLEWLCPSKSVEIISVKEVQ